MGYITEAHPQGYQITLATQQNQLFEHCIFSKSASDLTVVRCWQDQQLKALPDTQAQTYADIMEKIRRTYENESLVWNGQNSLWDRSACINYLRFEIRSLIALPVFAGKAVIAAIILHSKEANYFDHEKLDKLRNLVSRVAWLLMVTEQTKQRQLLLDGIIHEIKSDVSPLKRALQSLPENNHSLPAWRRSVYCATRLEMAVKNLLLMNRGLPKDKKNESASLYQVLSNLAECYQRDMEEREKTLVIEPHLDDVNSIWQIVLPMSVEWLTLIVVNLLDNAVKYGKRGEIKIRATRSPNELMLSILNIGTLSPEQENRAFTPSYQSEHGTGFHVGLASCKLVMEKHNGTIQLRQQESSSPCVLATVTWPINDNF